MIRLAWRSGQNCSRYGSIPGNGDFKSCGPGTGRTFGWCATLPSSMVIPEALSGNVPMHDCKAPHGSAPNSSPNVATMNATQAFRRLAMPVHDWTRVEAGIFHAFHVAWVPELQR